MSSTIAQLRHGASPFDHVKQVDERGEFWSARDLQQPLGYVEWRKFEDSIERAIAAIENSGMPGQDHVGGAAKMIATGKGATRIVDDYRLTRYGAYMVAMNGDARKPEVAAAQTYFAVRTREAEVARSTDITALPSRDILKIVQRLVETEDARDRAEHRAARSERVVNAIEAAEGLTPTEFHKHYFSDVPERVFFERIYALRLLIDQRGARGRDSKGRIKNGHEHGHPAAAGKPFFYLHGRLDGDGIRRESTRVRPGRPEVALVEFLAGKGLIPNPNALTTGPVAKGIAA